MLRRLFRTALTLGFLGAAAAAVARALGGRQAPQPAAAPLPRQDWPPLEPGQGDSPAAPTTALQPDPDAPTSAPVTEEAPLAPAPEAADATADDPEPMPAPTDVVVADAAVGWVEPDGDVCPTTHPVKAKLASKIFHVPGGLSYARVKPDRCYADAAAAEADGLRPAKR